MARAKQIPAIDCEAPASEGIRLVLSSRFEEMCALRAQALNWKELDGVHDMRVASRRLRGALRDFTPYIRRRPLSACLKEIKALGRALGRVRDHDVALMELEKIAAKAPPEFSTGVREFAKVRQPELKAARAKLTNALEADALAQLKMNFLKSLDTATAPVRARKPPPPACATFREVARAVIIKRLDEFEKLAECFRRPLKVKPLHKLRIAAKHLRYALELFAPCWGSGPAADQSTPHSLKVLTVKVANMQASLGNLHDADVWIESFGEVWAHDLPGLDFDQRETSIWLLSHFIKLRGKDLSKALVQWNEWQTDKLSEQVRKTIEPQRNAGAGQPQEMVFLQSARNWHDPLTHTKSE